MPFLKSRYWIRYIFYSSFSVWTCELNEFYRSICAPFSILVPLIYVEKVQCTGYSVRHQDLEHTIYWNSTEHRMKMEIKNETENCPYCNDTSESPTNTSTSTRWTHSHIAHRTSNKLYNCNPGSQIQPIPICFLINTWNRIFLFIFAAFFIFIRNVLHFLFRTCVQKNPFIIIMDRVDVCY